ncbi:MAG: zinc-ribbon domain-containing protein [Polyangiaceae bacterium]|nr:zinc-ribbon domain-containing protein [Polyangiaceae bacterium]
MLKVECESCRAPYQVDERRVPDAGLKMRCPKCGHTFVVTDPKRTAPDPVSVTPAAIRSMKQTSPGIGSDDANTRPPAMKITGASVHDEIDLPSFAGNVGLPLPVTRAPGGPAGAAKKPATPAARPVDFDIDLPAVAASARRAGAAPPARTFGTDNADLPARRERAADPPSPNANVADLPALPANLSAFGSDLPVPEDEHGFGEIDLPSPSTDLPRVVSARPQTLTTQAELAHEDDPVANAFGEIDLPAVGTSASSSSLLDLPSPSRAGGVDFGELDLPADPAAGMAFREVSLGGDDAQLLGPLPATSAGSFALEDVPLPVVQSPAAASIGKPLAHDVEIKKPASKRLKILVACAAIAIAGGAALQLTPVGAFGYLAISDKIHEGQNAFVAAVAGDAARKRLALDTYAEAVAAADELADRHKYMPRARPVTAYAAFLEFANAVRFGGDHARAARAKTYLSDIPKGTDVPYLATALAAQDAAAGEWPRAKAGLEAAAAKEPKDGIQIDIAIMRGEVALAQQDVQAAVNAFNEARAKGGPSARAEWGLARAYDLAKNAPKQSEAVDATLKLSPKHAGAHAMHALLAWQMHRDDAALKELDAILSEPSRSALGISELAAALAAKGSIMVAQDRTTEARTAFDEAVKVDPRNVAALIGQGQVLYVDGRYTEALTRFDEAAKKDPTSLAAALGGARTKIALERFADAKADLTAAQKRAPKDMSVALWLARTEEALGDRVSAEKLYASAVDLADPKNADAIEAYAALASFLAAQGRTSEASAKLEQARAKLPDSAALQRAFGEVTAAEGHFDQAVEHFAAALEKNPNDLGARFQLGVTYRRMGNFDQASEQFDRIVAVDKDYPGIALERGQIFEKSGHVEQALEQFQSAYAKAPKDVDLAMRMGAALVTIGKVDEAIPLLETVRAARPNSAEMNHFLGRAKLQMGGLESAAAMRYLQRAVELDPNRADYHLYVARAANESSPVQLTLARAEVDKALSLDKLLADGYWQRGVVELREGAVNDAVKDLRRALELKPSRYEAHAALAETYEQKNDIASAMSEWVKAIAGDGTQAAWRYQYGRLLFDKGKVAEAAKHLSFAVDAGKTMQPRPGWLGPAAFQAGEALRKVGQKAKAIEAYNLYMELAAPTAADRRDAVRALKDLGAP